MRFLVQQAIDVRPESLGIDGSCTHEGGVDQLSGNESLPAEGDELSDRHPGARDDASIEGSARAHGSLCAAA